MSWNVPVVLDESKEVSEELREKWRLEQHALRDRMVIEDSFKFTFTGSGDDEKKGDGGGEELRLVGGVDISFLGVEAPEVACVALAVVAYPSLKTVSTVCVCSVCAHYDVHVYLSV
jgi:deoxyinosine 3'endonuclease (endonuclease V)